MVVDPEVDDPVEATLFGCLAPDDQDPSGLAAPKIAARSLRTLEPRQQAFRERPGCRREGLGERVDDGRRAEHVPLRREVLAADRGCGRDAGGARVDGRRSGRVDDGDLSKVAQIVSRRQPGERGGRRFAAAQQLERERAVASQRERLRRHRTNARRRPRNGRTGAERATLNADAELPCRRVSRDQGVGHEPARSEAL